MVTQYCFSLWHYELCGDDDSEGRDDDDDGDGDVESAGDNDWLVTMVLVVTQLLKEGGTVPPPFNIIPTLKVTNIIVTIIQGDFFHWNPPKKLKFGKPRLGEFTFT